MASDPARKRQRVSITDTLNLDSDSPDTISVPTETPTLRKASNSTLRTVRELREIIGRHRKGLISYTALVEQIIVLISLLDLF
jgi:hypothetical protein